MVTIYLIIIMCIFIYVINKNFLNFGIVLYNSLINILIKNMNQLIIINLINNLRNMIINLNLKIFKDHNTLGVNEQLIYRQNE